MSYDRIGGSVRQILVLGVGRAPCSFSNNRPRPPPLANGSQRTCLAHLPRLGCGNGPCTILIPLLPDISLFSSTECLTKISVETKVELLSPASQLPPVLPAIDPFLPI